MTDYNSCHNKKLQIMEDFISDVRQPGPGSRAGCGLEEVKFGGGGIC